MTRFESSVREMSPSSALAQPHVNLADPESRTVLRVLNGVGNTDNSFLKEMFVGQEKTKEIPKPGNEPRMAQKGEIAPTDKVDQAAAEYERTGKLTPEIKKFIESAIAEADKGPSPKIPGLETKIKALEADLKKAMPDETREKIEKAVEVANEKIRKSTPEVRKELNDLIIQSYKGTPEEKAAANAGIEKLMQSIAPKEYNEAKKLAAPAQEINKKLEEVKNDLAVQKHHAFWTRLDYAQILWDADEKKAAQDQLKSAVTKFPKALDSPDIQEIIKQMGLDKNDFRPKRD